MQPDAMWKSKQVGIFSSCFHIRQREMVENLMQLQCIVIVMHSDTIRSSRVFLSHEGRIVFKLLKEEGRHSFEQIIPEENHLLIVLQMSMPHNSSIYEKSSLGGL